MGSKHRPQGLTSAWQTLHSVSPHTYSGKILALTNSLNEWETEQAGGEQEREEGQVS